MFFKFGATSFCQLAVSATLKITFVEWKRAKLDEMMGARYCMSSMVKDNEGISAASFCCQVAALVPDML